VSSNKFFRLYIILFYDIRCFGIAVKQPIASLFNSQKSLRLFFELIEQCKFMHLSVYQYNTDFQKQKSRCITATLENELKIIAE
ncbi:MAG: hypothetical protein JXQ69_06275, partial [Paludibacteraceae bacterium]|nr:hypothetical protein [Paludibacteraceae bacterium]